MGNPWPSSSQGYHAPGEGRVSQQESPRRQIRLAQQLQQTGMPLTITQQVQPAFIKAVHDSQHAWIIAQQSLSPLVQVRQTPFSVGSHLHWPIVRLQQQATIPLSMQQQLHMPPGIVAQRFCSMPADTLSSQVHVIFMPPEHFSIFIVHRGTITMFVTPGVMAGLPRAPAADAPRPAMPIPLRSIIIALVMGTHLVRIERNTSLRRSLRRTRTHGHYDKHIRYFNFGVPKNRRILFSPRSSICRRSSQGSARPPVSHAPPRPAPSPPIICKPFRHSLLE
jgi:hypothetical protein